MGWKHDSHIWHVQVSSVNTWCTNKKPWSGPLGFVFSHGCYLKVHIHEHISFIHGVILGYEIYNVVCFTRYAWLSWLLMDVSILKVACGWSLTVPVSFPRELQAERQRSQNFPEKCKSLTCIQKMLEEDSISQETQSFSSLQDMLAVHKVFTILLPSLRHTFQILYVSIISETVIIFVSNQLGPESKWL